MGLRCCGRRRRKYQVDGSAATSNIHSLQRTGSKTFCKVVSLLLELESSVAALLICSRQLAQLYLPGYHRVMITNQVPQLDLIIFQYPSSSSLTCPQCGLFSKHLCSTSHPLASASSACCFTSLQSTMRSAFE